MSKQTYWFLLDDSAKNWVGSQGYDGNQGFYATVEAWSLFEKDETDNTIWIPFPEDIKGRLQTEIDFTRMQNSFWKRLKFLFTKTLT